MREHISSRAHFPPWKFRKQARNLLWHVSRRFADNLKIVQHRVDGFQIVLEGKLIHAMDVDYDPVHRIGDILQTLPP